jgi:hypothetical protein
MTDNLKIEDCVTYDPVTGVFDRNVALDKRRGTYYAQVRAFGKTYSKSGLESAELAEMVADELRSRLHKEFAYERG